MLGRLSKRIKMHQHNRIHVEGTVRRHTSHDINADAAKRVVVPWEEAADTVSRNMIERCLIASRCDRWDCAVGCPWADEQSDARCVIVRYEICVKHG